MAVLGRDGDRAGRWIVVVRHHCERTGQLNGYGFNLGPNDPNMDLFGDALAFNGVTTDF